MGFRDRLISRRMLRNPEFMQSMQNVFGDLTPDGTLVRLHWNAYKQDPVGYVQSRQTTRQEAPIQQVGENEFQAQDAYTTASGHNIGSAAADVRRKGLQGFTFDGDLYDTNGNRAEEYVSGQVYDRNTNRFNNTYGVRPVQQAAAQQTEQSIANGADLSNGGRTRAHFSRAFATARNNGLSTFMWNGKMYDTALAVKKEAPAQAETPVQTKAPVQTETPVETVTEQSQNEQSATVLPMFEQVARQSAMARRNAPSIRYGYDFDTNSFRNREGTSYFSPSLIRSNDGETTYDPQTGLYHTFDENGYVGSSRTDRRGRLPWQL